MCAARARWRAGIGHGAGYWGKIAGVEMQDEVCTTVDRIVSRHMIAWLCREGRQEASAQGAQGRPSREVQGCDCEGTRRGGGHLCFVSRSNPGIWVRWCPRRVGGRPLCCSFAHNCTTCVSLGVLLSIYAFLLKLLAVNASDRRQITSECVRVDSTLSVLEHPLTQ